MALYLETEIHPAAIVDTDAELDEGVRVGPYAIVGPGVKIGSGTEVGPHAQVVTNAIVGRDCKIYAGAIIGNDPQDLKFRGLETYVSIGDRTIIREYVTISRGTEENIWTRVGSD